MAPKDIAKPLSAECLTHGRNMGIRVWLPRRARRSHSHAGRGDLLMSGVHTLRGTARFCLPALLLLILLASGLAGPRAVEAQAPTATPAPPASVQHQGGGEANLKIPELAQVSFGAMTGRRLLQWGLIVCLFGFAFGLVFYQQLKNLPVHQSMRDISELIYETCKTYLVTQGKFLLILWIFIAIIVTFYFGVLQH